MIIDKPFVHLFKTVNGYYIFDVNINQIVKIKKEIYDILYQQLISDNTQVTFDDNDESTKIISNMIKRGFLSSRKTLEIVHPADELLEYSLNNKIQKITLQVTQNCNLRCKYCIYTSSDIGKQRKHSNKQMPLETALRGIDFALERTKDNDKFNVGFYGGEPTLMFDMIKKCVEYTEEKAEGKELSFNITTNGTLLNEKLIEFFEKHNVTLTISLDGPKEIHDKNRCFAQDGNGTFDIIMNNIEKLRGKYPEYFSKIFFNAVLDPETDFKCTNEFFMNYETIKGMGVNSTIVDNKYSQEKPTFSEAFIIEREYEMFKVFLHKLGRIDEKYISELSSKRFLDIEKYVKRLLPTDCLQDKTHHAGPCIPGEARLFMDINGNFFPCERVSETSEVTKIGHIDSGFNMENIRNILNIGKITESNCKNCWALKYCTLCVAFADNITELSAEIKKSKCESVRASTENIFKTYVTLRDYGYNFEV
jgi:CLI_3235-class bacteriocin maturation radical SAM enzyme